MLQLGTMPTIGNAPMDVNTFVCTDGSASNISPRAQGITRKAQAVGHWTQTSPRASEGNPPFIERVFSTLEGLFEGFTRREPAAPGTGTA